MLFVSRLLLSAPLIRFVFSEGFCLICTAWNAKAWCGPHAVLTTAPRPPSAWVFCPNKAGKALFQEICHSSKRFKRPWHRQFYVELLRQVCCLPNICLGGCKGYFRPSLRMAKSSWVTQVPGPNRRWQMLRATSAVHCDSHLVVAAAMHAGAVAAADFVAWASWRLLYRSHPRKASMLVCNRLLGQSRVRATNLPNARGWTPLTCACGART